MRTSVTSGLTLIAGFAIGVWLATRTVGRAPTPTSPFAAPEPPRIPETTMTSPPVAPAAAPIPASRRELDAIQQLIGQYAQMHDQLDARAIASIWPTVDTHELNRIFSRLQQQNLSFDSCVFALAQSTATAQCNGWLRYVPRVGNQTPHNEHHLWTIQLARASGTWSIVNVSAR
jgi:hypothetical protein